MANKIIWLFLLLVGLSSFAYALFDEQYYIIQQGTDLYSQLTDVNVLDPANPLLVGQGVVWDGNDWVNTNFLNQVFKEAVWDFNYTPPASPEDGNRWIVVPGFPANWYNTSWMKRQKIVLSKLDVNGVDLNFPVLIYLDDQANELFTYAKNNGSDIVITDSSGTRQLNYELDYYNSTVADNNANFAMWVRIQDLNWIQDTNLYAYYSNASATFTNSTNTWDANTIQVYHFKDWTLFSPNYRTYSSKTTSQYFNMVSYPILDGNIFLGRSVLFNGTTQYGQSATIPNYDTYTYSAWFKSTQNQPLRTIIARYFSAPTVGMGNGIFLHNGRVVCQVRNSAKVDYNVISGTGYNDGNWHLVTITHDKPTNSLTCYVDDKNIGAVTTSGTTVGTGYSYRIAGPTITGSSYFGGNIDEVRIDNKARDFNWQKTRYDTEKVPNSFNTWLSETGGSALGAWAGNEQCIAEYLTPDWSFECPQTGWAAYVTNKTATYSFNGSTWVKIASIVNHNDLLNIQGGTDTERYHVTNTGASNVTSVSAITSGIVTKTSSLAYIGRILTGTANRLSVINGNGVAGNPTFDINVAYDLNLQNATLAKVFPLIDGNKTLAEQHVNANIDTNRTKIIQDFNALRVDVNQNFAGRIDLNILRADFPTGGTYQFDYPAFDTNFKKSYDSNVIVIMDGNRGRIDTNVNTWRKTDTNSIVSKIVALDNNVTVSCAGSDKNGQCGIKLADTFATRMDQGVATTDDVTFNSVSGDGSGLTGITASPAGANTQIQFNNSGSLGADNAFVWNAVNNRLGVGNQSPAYAIDLAGSQTTSDSNYVRFTPNNGGATYSAATYGGGIAWIPNYSGYSKKSAGILQTAERNYFQSGIAFLTNNASDNSTDWVERMRLSYDGNLGIGTASPSNKLNVIGDINALGGIYDQNFLVLSRKERATENSAIPSPDINLITKGYDVDLSAQVVKTATIRANSQAGAYAGTQPPTYLDFIGNRYNNTLVRMDMDSKYVGINTTAPATTLDINGLVTGSGVRARGGTAGGYAGMFVQGTNSLNYVQLATSTELIDARINNVKGAFLVQLDGNVGIGTSTAQSKLDVNGFGRFRWTPLDMSRVSPYSGMGLEIGGWGGNYTSNIVSATRVPGNYDLNNLGIYGHDVNILTGQGVGNSATSLKIKADGSIYAPRLANASGGEILFYDAGNGHITYAAWVCPDVLAEITEIVEDNVDGIPNVIKREIGQGGILEALISEELEDEDVLLLSNPSNELIIAENKDEVSYFKSAKLTVDGTDYPAIFSGDFSLEGSYYVLRKGQRGRLTFKVDLKNAREVYLKATGYYIPTEDAKGMYKLLGIIRGVMKENKSLKAQLANVNAKADEFVTFKTKFCADATTSTSGACK